MPETSCVSNAQSVVPERLDPTEREQESSPAVHDVRTERDVRCDLAASRDLA